MSRFERTRLMRAMAMACVAAWLCVDSLGAATQPTPLRLIFDTDIMGDVDDVGTVAVLHALADLGEAEILVMGVSSKNPWSPLCLSALNTYFGRGDIPLGVLKGPGSSKRSRYAKQIAEEFPRKLKSLDEAPDAARVYRRVLAARNDKSVVIVSVGFLSNLRDLLMTKPDGLSPLDGRELVAKRVKAWVCMGGQFPQGPEACNFRRDAPAAAYVIEHWPTPIVFSGGELGIRVQTGAGLTTLPADSPVRRAYELYNGLTNRASWDQTAVLYAVRGLSGGLKHVWDLHAKGSIDFDAKTAYVKWRGEAQRGHAYLVEKMPPKQVARLIEDLMLHLPSGAARARGEEPKPLPWIEGSTTLAVLPDTEVYSKQHPEHFEAQTKWILANRDKRSIAYAIHLGDITQRNAPREWEVARRCLGILDGKVPYALVTGNHDYDDNAPKRDTTRLTEHFPLAAIQEWPTFGSVHTKGKLDNSYHLLSIGGRKWIILALECGPRNEVVAWANQVLDRHADRLAIVVTHAYLFRNNTRYDHTSGRRERASPHGWGNDGEELWQKLVRRHRNAMIVLSGHVSTGGLGYLASEGDHGNTVHQMMVDYEKMRGGGMAYLRLLEFLPDGKTVQVRTYSPVLKSTRQSELEEFRFELKLADRDRPRPRDDGRNIEKRGRAK